MPELKIEIPDAWITEWGLLFVVHHTYRRRERYVEAANAALEDWEYPIRLSARDFWYPDQRWIDPKYASAEQWPVSAVSSVPVEGWVKLYRFDLEKLADRTIGASEEGTR